MRNFQIIFEYPQEVNTNSNAIAKNIAKELLSKKIPITEAIEILNCAAGYILFTPLSSEVPEIEANAQDR